MDDEPISNTWSINWSDMQSGVLMLLLSLLVFILAAGTIIRQNNSIKETLVQMETQCLQSPPNQVDKHE